MDIPRQQTALDDIPRTGPRARTLRVILDTAEAMIRDGQSPSVSEVAEAAGVSRSTAYRYFPTQSAMVQAIVAQTLGPILDWETDLEDPEERIAALFRETLPRLVEHEVTFRAALRLSLEIPAGEAGVESGRRFARGHRVELLGRATSPLADVLAPEDHARLTRALSVYYGAEGIVALRDIWGSGVDEVIETMIWAARSLVRQALEEAAGGAAEGG